MKLKSILYILMLLPFLWSCNNEDDVEEIFASGTWHVVDFYGKANWDKRNGEPKYNAMAHNPDKTIATEGRKALDIIHGFNITFKADGTFTGSIQNGTIEGTWQARLLQPVVQLLLPVAARLLLQKVVRQKRDHVQTAKPS